MGIPSRAIGWLRAHRPSPLTIGTIVVCAAPVIAGFVLAEEGPAATEAVLVPRHEVGAYRYLTCRQLRRENKPAASVPDDAVRTCATARDRVTRRSIDEGRTIRERQLTARVSREAVDGRAPVSFVAPSIPHAPEPGRLVDVVLTPTTSMGSPLVLRDVVLLDLEPGNGETVYVVGVIDEQLDAIAQRLGTSRVIVSPARAVTS